MTNSKTAIELKIKHIILIILWIIASVTTHRDQQVESSYEVIQKLFIKIYFKK